MTVVSTNSYWPRYHALVSSTTISRANTSWTRSGGCRDQITDCYNTSDEDTCSEAQSYCNNNILSPLAGNYDVYYVLTKNPDPYPPDLTSYLTSKAVTSKIGAESTWQETNDDVYSNFASTGDWMHNSRPDLETVINAGVRTIIYDGDAVRGFAPRVSPSLRADGHLQDFILNFNGVEAMVAALQTKFSSDFAKQQFANYTVKGQVTGLYNNSGTFSYVRIFGA